MELVVLSTTKTIELFEKIELEKYYLKTIDILVFKAKLFFYQKEKVKIVILTHKLVVIWKYNELMAIYSNIMKADNIFYIPRRAAKFKTRPTSRPHEYCMIISS